jgi:hypothetical protein
MTGLVFGVPCVESVYVACLVVVPAMYAKSFPPNRGKPRLSQARKTGGGASWAVMLVGEHQGNELTEAFGSGGCPGRLTCILEELNGPRRDQRDTGRRQCGAVVDHSQARH